MILPLTARREHGDLTVTSPTTTYSIPFNGHWVVRDAVGVYVDHDQYRNDLKSRYPGLEIERD